MERHLHSNLGEEPNSFIGRRRELDELRAVAATTRALTLCGPGGIGKTRLAVRLLAALAADYPDGTWLVELADVWQPDLVESRIAAVIGVTEEPGRPLIETLADVLRSQRVLLALDSCEHLIGSCARVCQRLLASSPGLRVIATSREPLRVAAETVWQVPPMSLPPLSRPALSGPALSLPPFSVPPPSLPPAGGVTVRDELLRSDAIRLFADRAAAAHPGFVLAATSASARAVVAICRALDGLPLAIELAAARVRVLSVEQIAARLDDRFRLLGTGERTAPPRQRTLRAAMDWSYDLLTRPEQILLRRLSVFAGWSLEMAEQLCAGDGLPGASIMDVLTALADKSLVVVEPAASGQIRYRMLDTIRDYAASGLAKAGESAMLQTRLRDYALREAEHLMLVGMAQTRASWPAILDVFREFEAETGNLRQVLGRCLAAGDAQTGLRICAAMRPVWIVQGSYAEGAEWLDAFLALEAPDVPAWVRGSALVGRGQLALASDPAGAAELATAGLELCRAAGEEFWTLTALNLLAEAALHAGRPAEAVAGADEAVAAARGAGDRWSEGYALGTRAAAAAQQYHLREAQQLAESALAIMREIDQQWGVARTLLGLGDLARLTADPDGAGRRYQEALAILRQVNARPEIARCLAGLGRIATSQGDLAVARQHLAESIELSQSIGSRTGVIRALDAFAVLAISEGSPERAVQLASAAAACRKAAQLPPPGSRTQRILDAAGLGEHVIRRLWAAGSAMSSPAAVTLALSAPRLPGPGAGHDAGAQGRSGAAEIPPGELTARERDVVALITQGRTNKSIGAELFISPATAARHVANIMGKLGFTSRAQIAAWARRGGGAGPASPAGQAPPPD